MAEQTGPFKFKGKLQGVVGYARDGKHFLRGDSTKSKRYWKTSPRLVRSRENALFFGAASKMGSGIYRFIPAWLKVSCRPYTHNLLASKVMQIRSAIGRVPNHIPGATCARNLVGLELGRMRERNSTSRLPEKGPSDQGKHLLRKGERLEFRISYVFLLVGELVLEADGSGYCWLAEPRLIHEIEGNWMNAEPFQQKSYSEFDVLILPPELGQIESGCCGLALRGVQYRAVNGRRIRRILDLDSVSIVGYYPDGRLDTTSCIAKNNKTSMPSGYQIRRYRYRGGRS